MSNEEYFQSQLSEFNVSAMEQASDAKSVEPMADGTPPLASDDANAVVQPAATTKGVGGLIFV